jgi:NAD(P)-dependent dehydrogenase (short-subunit alcohol dehydrogenase family)
MAEPNPLDLTRLNVAIVGSGGIASALAQHLLSEYPLETLLMLQRSDCKLHDPRVHRIAIDARDPQSVQDAGEKAAGLVSRLHLVINTVGVLHDDTVTPEKRLKDVTAQAMHHLMQVNAYLLPQLAQALAPLLRHSEPSVFASLSARVGSIADNDLGGWYSYRASKAAHNQLLRTLSREWRISHRSCCVVALHPGTVATALSNPFTPTNYTKTVLTPQECAQALVNVLAQLGPTDTGSFRAWDGAVIPW